MSPILKKRPSFRLPDHDRVKILDLALLGFSIGIGLLAALGALVFRLLIEFFQTLFWFGTGASVGREGPIVQIGSSVGSSLAQLFGLNPQLRRLCLACGAAAGIAATFNAPIAGSMFALEIILLNIEVSYISFIVIAAITGSVLSRLFWGHLPAFQITPFVLDNYWELSAYLILGIAAGFVSILFVKCIFTAEDGFNRIPIPDWCKPALVSGTTLAPITAILTIFEITLHYQIILPLMLACISSTLSHPLRRPEKSHCGR